MELPAGDKLLFRKNSPLIQISQPGNCLVVIFQQHFYFTAAQE
jgi:hypothetical protein